MSAIISDCGRYRYRLDRLELRPDGPRVAVIMVNPSTADAVDNDATIRKLLGFARERDWSDIVVGNLFAYRATDVRELKRVADPVGPDNDGHLMDIMREADSVVVGWGPIKKQPIELRGRYKRILTISSMVSRPLYSIGPPAKDGHPKHPLMLPYDLDLQPWKDPAQ